MPIDGVVVRSIVCELSEKLINGRIDKISQPEPDEVILSVRNGGQNYKLLISASPNYPRIHITNLNKQNPLNAPMFCMVLRKYISSGKIVKIEQQNLDRIIKIYIESYDELGTLSNKILLVEIMGRRSNITLINESNGIILDSVKHLTAEMNSYRQILPGIKFIYPPSQDKLNTLDFSTDELMNRVEQCSNTMKLGKFISSNLDGISLFSAKEICYIAALNPETAVSDMSESEIARFTKALSLFLDAVKKNIFKPCIYFDNDSMLDFYSMNLNYLKRYAVKQYESISALIEEFYFNKDKSDRARQKSSDIHKIVNNNLNRCYKKLAIQQEKLDECSEKDKWKLYGDLITSNIYSLKKGDSKAIVTNYYDENQAEVEIPLDMLITPVENAQRYYKKYTKDKTAETVVTKQKEENSEEIEYLESVLLNLQNCTEDNEIDEIRTELIQLGYKKKGKGRASRKKVQSKPMNFISSEGFDIFVGKNNMQNDYLTLKFASSNDIWMHTKKIPGSHVIIKTNGKVPGQATLDEAANLAAYYSKARESSNVPVDYTERKNVKKPSGAKPGMVIYYTNRTLYITPDPRVAENIEKKD